jgi:hypothetical protein
VSPGITDLPSVHIVIPTLGTRRAWLAQAVESALGQTYPRLDVTIVSPTSVPLQWLPWRQVGIERCDEEGAAAAINCAFQGRQHHSYVGWLGDDDLLEKDSVSACVEAMESSQSSVAAFGNVNYIRGDGSLWFTWRTPRYVAIYLPWGKDLLPQPGSLFRRAALESIGWLDPSLRNGFDLDVFLRLRDVGDLVRIDQNLASFRVHSQGITSTKGQHDESDSIRLRSHGRVGRAGYRVIRPATRRLDRLIWRQINARRSVQPSAVVDARDAPRRKSHP